VLDGGGDVLLIGICFIPPSPITQKIGDVYQQEQAVERLKSSRVLVGGKRFSVQLLCLIALPLIPRKYSQGLKVPRNVRMVLTQFLEPNRECLGAKLLCRCRVTLTTSECREVFQAVRRLWMIVAEDAPPYLQCSSKQTLGLLKFAIPRTEPPKATDDIRNFSTLSSLNLDTNAERILVVCLGKESTYRSKPGGDFRCNVVRRRLFRSIDQFRHPIMPCNCLLTNPGGTGKMPSSHLRQCHIVEAIHYGGMILS